MATVSWHAVLVVLIAVSGARTQDTDERDLFEFVSGVGYYHVVETPLNWTQAYQYCQNLDSLLAVANSDTEAMVLTRMAQRSNLTDFAFIGVSDLNDKGQFITVEGDLISQAGYNVWTGNDSSLLRCVGISTSGEGLIRAHCSQQSHAICEIPIWKRQYTLVEGVGYYRGYGSHWSWPESVEQCRSHGGHLAVINSQEEYVAIQAIFNADIPVMPFNHYDFVWIGGHSQYNYMNYVTMFGVPINETGYNTWSPGEPVWSPGYLALDRNGHLTTRFAFTGFPQGVAAICEHPLQ